MKAIILFCKCFPTYRRIVVTCANTYHIYQRYVYKNSSGRCKHPAGRGRSAAQRHAKYHAEQTEYRR